MTWKMEIRREIEGGVVVLAVRGRLGSEAAPGLAESLDQAMNGDNSLILLDLEGVDYVSGAALKVMTTAADRLAEGGGRLLACTPNEPVTLAFDLAGLSERLALEPSRAAAMARLRARPQPIRS